MLIPGTTSIAHLDDNMAAAGIALDDEQWDAVEAVAATITPWRPEPTPGREEVR